MISRIYGSTDSITIEITGLADIGKSFSVAPENINDIIFELRSTNNVADTPIWTKSLGGDITTSDPDVIIAWDAGDYTNLTRGRTYYGRLAIEFNDALGVAEGYYRTIASDADIIRILPNDIQLLDLEIDENFQITGLLEAGGWIPIDLEGIVTIESVDVEAIMGCEDCDWSTSQKIEFTIDLDQVSNYWSVSGDVITINPAAFAQTGAISDLEDGIYTLVLKINVDDGVTVTDNEQSYTVCNVVDTNLKCCIAEIIKDNLNDTVLVPMWHALDLAKGCGDCCLLCNLYTSLSERVDNYNCDSC